jgi:ElaB/YqjD/DUF883 family membrane-anchored ribosome-binding protein
MLSSLHNPLKHNVEAALEDVAKTLHAIAADAEGLSKEASEALAKAAVDVRHAAESLRQHAAATAKKAVGKAAHEVQEHPIASLAAAITAAAALVSVITSKRNKDT